MNVFGNQLKLPTSSLAELGCLFRREQSSYSYKRTSTHEHWGTSLSIHWRHKICEWCYDFIDHYTFDREVVGVAMYYFDCYISKQTSYEETHTKDQFQTIAVTSLFLAIKLHSMSEDCLAENRANALSRLLCDNVDPKVIYEIERDILHKLNWRLNPPTLHQFALYFSRLHPLGECCATTTCYLYEATRYQVELAIFSLELLETFSSPVIAFAALQNAEEKIAADNPHILNANVEQYFESLLGDQALLDTTDVRRCQASLRRLCPQLPELSDFGDADENANSRVVTPHDYSAQEYTSAASFSPINVAGN